LLFRVLFGVDFAAGFFGTGAQPIDLSQGKGAAAALGFDRFIPAGAESSR
jgi:hypothetical protein